MASPYALDFSPVANALSEARQHGLALQQQEMARNRLAMEQERLGFERTRQPFELAQLKAQTAATKDDALKRKAGLYGNFLESHVSKMSPEERAAAWPKFLASGALDKDDLEHPTFGPMLRDPELGYKLMLGFAAPYRDEIAKRTAEAGIKKAEQDAIESGAKATLATAQAKKADRGEPLDEAIAELVRRTVQSRPGAAPQSAAPAPAPPPTGVRPPTPLPPGSVRPMGGPTPDVAPTDPNLIRVQAAPPQQSAAPQPLQNREEEVIVTPYGQMTRQQARELAGVLALAPGRAEAAKLLAEAAGPSNPQFGKEGQNELDKKQINASNHIARLRAVEQSFDPKFLQIPQRIGMAWTSLKAKIKDITPEQAQPLAEFAEFRRASVENMSRLLNELSGAAVSPQEYERIRNTQPDAGTGIFDGDDPVTFEAKMRGVVRDQKRAIARYNYLRREGPQAKAPWDVMALDEIDKVINRRGAELNQQLRQANPKASPAVVDQEVKAQLSREFGIQI